jgi:hypothetical protein
MNAQNNCRKNVMNHAGRESNLKEFEMRKVSFGLRPIDDDRDLAHSATFSWEHFRDEIHRFCWKWFMHCEMAYSFA